MSARPRASAGRAWLERLTLRGVLIVTLPLFALLAWLLFMPVLDYARASQFDDWWSRSAHVHRFLWMRLADAWRQPAYERLESRIDPRDPGGVSVRIFVDRAEYDRIAARAPENMETWLEAELDEAGKRLPVEIRLRGDSSAHWTAEKKSLSVKTPRDDFFHGQRRFALSIKDVLPQAVLGDLAREFGVLAPETAVVPVFLDERFHGLYRFVETPDESFLRRQGHMPGNVFRADRAERGEYMKGLARGVFKDPALWDRAAFNDRPGAAGTAALGLFLADLNGSERADHERVWGWLERAEIARLLAFLLLAGDPYHMSAVHNQFWYEEPASGRLHPVAWDVRLLDLAAASERLNPFWRQVLRDPRLFDAALGELERRLDEGLAERAVRAAEQTWARQRAAFDYERLRAGRVPDVGDAHAVARGIAANVATLREWMADARASALCTPYPSRDLTVVDVEVAGFAGLELSGLAAPRALPEGLRLFADANANGALDAEDRPLAARAEVRAGQPGLWLDEPLRLLARIDTSGPGLTPAHSPTACSSRDPGPRPRASCAHCSPTASAAQRSRPAPWRPARRCARATPCTPGAGASPSRASSAWRAGSSSPTTCSCRRERPGTWRRARPSPWLRACRSCSRAARCSAARAPRRSASSAPIPSGPGASSRCRTPARPGAVSSTSASTGAAAR